MSTETAGPVVSSAKSSMQDAMKANLREYGLIIALIAIMLFFQYMTKGVLFLPVNLTNIVLQNSYIVVMALGMLLVIVAGHIDLSVGSVAGFIGGLAAILMVDYGVNPLLAALLCIAAGAAIGGVQGYFVAYMKIPSFIVTLAGMLVFKGLLLWLLGGRSLGPFPVEFQMLSAGFIPDIIGAWTIVAPTVDAATGKVVPNTGIVLHGTTMVVGLLIVAGMLWSAFRSRANRESHGYEAEPFGFFIVKNLVLAGIIMFLMYKFASYKGLPNVLIVMGILIAGFVFLTKRMTFGRRIFAMGGNIKAAALSGINTERLTFYIFAIMGALAGLAGLIYAARLNQATPKAGAGMELDVIAAVFVGAFIMGVMNNGMGIMGINIDWQQVIKGLVLLGAVAFDLYNKKKA